MGYTKPKLPVPENLQPVVREFFEEIARQGLRIEDVADISGVAASTMYSWRTRFSPQLNNFEASLNAVGLELTVRRRGG